MKVTVTIDGQTFSVEVGDLHARPIQATVDGQPFEVWPEEETQAATPAPLTAAAATAAAASPAPPRPVVTVAAKPANGASAASAITAPIPGVIIAVAVQAGATVRAGEELCTLEAMKMNNTIRAPRDGRISGVAVSVGQSVRQRQVLMEYAD
jgi:biotin carboxyl carrier protein